MRTCDRRLPNSINFKKGKKITITCFIFSLVISPLSVHQQATLSNNCGISPPSEKCQTDSEQKYEYLQKSGCWMWQMRTDDDHTEICNKIKWHLFYRVTKFLSDFDNFIRKDFFSAWMSIWGCSSNLIALLINCSCMAHVNILGMLFIWPLSELTFLLTMSWNSVKLLKKDKSNIVTATIKPGMWPRTHVPLNIFQFVIISSHHATFSRLLSSLSSRRLMVVIRQQGGWR